MGYANGTSPIIKERTAIHLLKAAVDGAKHRKNQEIDYTKTNALALAMGISSEEAEGIIKEVIRTDKSSEDIIREANLGTRRLNEQFKEEIRSKVAELRKS
jgi:hypothetical protein